MTGTPREPEHLVSQALQAHAARAGYELEASRSEPAGRRVSWPVALLACCALGLLAGVVMGLVTLL